MNIVIVFTLPTAKEKESKYLDFKEDFMKNFEIFVQQQ